MQCWRHLRAAKAYVPQVRRIVTTLLALAATLPACATEPVPLTHDGRFKFCPVFTGMGRQLVYVELASPTIYRLTQLNLEDGTTTALHPEATTSEFDPAFSAEGKVYAYLKTVGALRVNLEIHEHRGGKLGEVVPAGGFSGMRSPAVSPDGTHVAYSFAEQGRQNLFEVRADGSAKRKLTDSKGIDNWPAYARDGKSLVFGSSRDGDFEIYRMPAGGGEATRLTNSPGQDIRPKFSPEGNRIAFTSHRDGNAEIYVMNADGSAPQRITAAPDRDDYAEWHPDGRHLVIVCERNGRHDLYLVPAE